VGWGCKPLIHSKPKSKRWFSLPCRVSQTSSRRSWMFAGVTRAGASECDSWLFLLNKNLDCGSGSPLGLRKHSGTCGGPLSEKRCQALNLAPGSVEVPVSKAAPRLHNNSPNSRLSWLRPTFAAGFLRPTSKAAVVGNCASLFR